MKNFEGHLHVHVCEVIWQNRVTSTHQDIIVEFFNLVRECYSLVKECDLLVRQPLFNIWSAKQGEDRVIREDADDVTLETHNAPEGYQSTKEQSRVEVPSTLTADADPPLPAGESHHSNTEEHPPRPILHQHRKPNPSHLASQRERSPNGWHIFTYPKDQVHEEAKP